jgi:hypothetical protein
MSKNAPPTTLEIDTSFIVGNDSVNPELTKNVSQVIDYFNNKFGLTIDGTGRLQDEPSSEQLSELRVWNEATSHDGIIMPDMDTFTAKMVLAHALMPQRDDNGNITFQPKSMTWS